MKQLLILPLLLAAAVASADEPMCATGPANDERLRAIHDRPRDRARVAANGELAATVRDGAFYVPVDDLITPGYRPFDLEGQSLVFTPANGTYAVQRTALQYVEPAGSAFRDFHGATGSGWHAAEYNLTSFAFPIFGQARTKLYLSAFNGIHFSPPRESNAMQFDDVEAAVYRDPLLSPLMITTSKPTRLHYPKVYVDERPGSVFITWRSTTAVAFHYDVQVELREDGSFVYSYRTLLRMRWGTPIVSRGFDPVTAPYRTLAAVNDTANDVPSSAVPALRSMADLRRVEVLRVNESDLFAIRLQLGAPVQQALIESNQGLRFIVEIGSARAFVDIFREHWTITNFYAATSTMNGAAVRISGNTVDIYGVQLDATSLQQLRVWSLTRPNTNTADFASLGVVFDVPLKRTATDLSAADGDQLALPITEPFLLGTFDPRTLWERLQAQYTLSDYAIDAVAMYQTYFTDLVYYAGAYSTVGNPQVDGVRSGMNTYGTYAPRAPALLHMNQLEYGWNATRENSSHVMLHELGHRWLYFFNLNEGGKNARVLNPVSSHPGAFVHTPAAFPVYGSEESSVMGGAHFTQLPEGTFRARAANYGFSWTDLYLMGLAAPEEVPPWFYIANSQPELPLQYYATDGIVVSGEGRPVSVHQIIAAEGTRNPTTATSQRLIRVLFVLVTESGAEPTAAEVAKLNEWRALLEKNFSLATGGRARVDTNWVRPSKRRAAY